MENKISFDVNNGQIVELKQSSHNTDITVSNTDYDYTISNGDFVMLLNYYRFIKDNDIQCDFINYNGKNIKRRNL